MPIDIESFTTEVSLVDTDTQLGGPQIEQLVQEIIRRIERRQRENHQAERNAAFDHRIPPRK